MNPKHVPHPNDIRELASHRFFPEIRHAAWAGKTALLLYAHADEFDRLNQIRQFLARQPETLKSQSFEIDLDELAVRRDGPGVLFGALVDRPVKFAMEHADAHTWSCEFAVGEADTICTLHGRGPDLIGFELAGEAKLADTFQQADRDFLFQQLFALNKALEAYIRLNRL